MSDVNEEVVQHEIAVEQIQNIEESPVKADSPIAESKFVTVIDKIKRDIINDAQKNNPNFVQNVTNKVQNVIVKNLEVEEKLADFEKQKIELSGEKVDTAKQQNALTANENIWTNKEKCREYHYNGVKPIMKFVDIDEALNLPLLYFLTVVLFPFFLFAKFIKGTFGALLTGASDNSRSKAVKGFLWTILAIVILLIILAIIYLFLKWQGLIH